MSKTLKTLKNVSETTLAAAIPAAEKLVAAKPTSKKWKSKKPKSTEPKPVLTFKRAYKLLSLDKAKGILTNKISRPNSPAGEEPGYFNADGYRILTAATHQHRTAHIVWLMAFKELPVCTLDHINRERIDNRPINLRLATKSMNSFNRRVSPGRPYIGGLIAAGGKFKASLGNGNVRGSHIETYHIDLEAAVNRDIAARERGPYAMLNFPDEADFELAKKAAQLFADLRERANQVIKNLDTSVAAGKKVSIAAKGKKIGGAA